MKYKFTGNQALDARAAPVPTPLRGWVHAVLGLGTLFTGGILLPVWFFVGVVHWMFFYLPKKRKRKRFERAYRDYYSNMYAPQLNGRYPNES